MSKNQVIKRNNMSMDKLIIIFSYHKYVHHENGSMRDHVSIWDNSKWNGPWPRTSYPEDHWATILRGKTGHFCGGSLFYKCNQT